MKIPSFGYNAKISEIIKEKIKHDDLNYLSNYWITDKGTEHGNKHNYVRYYQAFFKPLKNKNINLLEIGVARGSSLKTWASFFNNIIIDGIDINNECKNLCKDYENINIIIGNSTKYKPQKNYDIIIDDGSHLSGDIINNFNNLINNLNKNGLYIIEDMHSCKNEDYITKFISRYENKIEKNKFIELNNRDRLDIFLNELKKNNKFKIELIKRKICFIRKLC